MSKISIIIALLISHGIPSLQAKPETLNSPRSTLVIQLPANWINSEAEINTVKIQREQVNGTKETIVILLDSKGVKTVSLPQGFPFKITTTRPSDEFPFTLIIFEREKKDIETNLVEAVALKKGVARFLNNEEFDRLAKTHASIPATIDSLNKELNELHKK